MPEGLTLFNTLETQFHLNKPLFQVRQTVTQSIPNTSPTNVSFDTVIYDSHGGWNSGASNYTVSVAGWYWVSILVEFQSNATGVRTCRLNQNNTGSSLLVHTMTPNASGNSAGAYLTGPVKCAIGDVIRVEAAQTSGGALGTQVTGGYTSVFSGDWMHR